MVFFKSCLSAVFVLILRGKEGTIRVAEVGRLSAKSKNAFNSFVGRVFANNGNIVFDILEIKA